MNFLVLFLLFIFGVIFVISSIIQAFSNMQEAAQRKAKDIQFKSIEAANKKKAKKDYLSQLDQKKEALSKTLAALQEMKNTLKASPVRKDGTV